VCNVPGVSGGKQRIRQAHEPCCVRAARASCFDLLHDLYFSVSSSQVRLVSEPPAVAGGHELVRTACGNGRASSWKTKANWQISTSKSERREAGHVRGAVERSFPRIAPFIRTPATRTRCFRFGSASDAATRNWLSERRNSRPRSIDEVRRDYYH